jgi:hypothetical protein
VHLSELRVGLSPIAKRIYIGIAPGQQQPVKFAHHLFDKILVRDQSNVNRQPTGGLNGLAVKSRQVKPISLKFETHRDSNAWAYLWFHLLALSLWNIRANHLGDKGHDNAKALPRPNQLIITTKQTEVSHSIRRIA